MNIVCPPLWFRRLYPKSVWEVPVDEQIIYLSFDDGPIPEVTPWVLKTLRQFEAKATFFCIGHNVEKHTEIYQEIVNEKHAIANHTYNHLQGVRTKSSEYYSNIRKAAKVINSTLFRPPHGLIFPWQSKYINKKMGYKLVMWDVLTQDYDKNISPTQCLNNALKYTQKGSVVVFHDSLKAEKNLKYALPRFLEHFTQKGFQFKSI